MFPQASTFHSSLLGRVTRHFTVSTVHMSLLAHITARCGSSIFCVFFRHLSVLRWENSRMCSSLTALHGGITLTSRVSGSQHHFLSNSYKLVRAPRRLRSHWLPHRSPTAQRPQALCPAHSHTVPTADTFGGPHSKCHRRCNVSHARRGRHAALVC